MAQAKHNPAKVRTEVVEVTPESITLHLSMEEASALLAVCRRVSGSSVSSRRRYFDRMSLVLTSVSVTDESSDIEDSYSMYFKARA